MLPANQLVNGKRLLASKVDFLGNFEGVENDAPEHYKRVGHNPPAPIMSGGAQAAALSWSPAPVTARLFCVIFFSTIAAIAEPSTGRHRARAEPKALASPIRVGYAWTRRQP
jgi:hypothetical protein